MFFLFLRGKKKTLWVIFCYCVYTFFNDILLISSHPKRVLSATLSTQSILNIFTIVEFVLFVSFFYMILKKAIIRRIILIMAVLFLIFDIYYNFSFHTTFDSIPVTIEAILIICLCIYYFFEQLNQMDQHEFIYSKPEFWAVAGIMLYLAGTFFLFVQAGELSKTTQITFWVINLGSNILKNVMFTVAFSLKGSNNKRSNNRTAITRTELN